MKTNQDPLVENMPQLCPLCEGDEFLLAEDKKLLICIDCGPVDFSQANMKLKPANLDKPHIIPFAKESRLEKKQLH